MSVCVYVCMYVCLCVCVCVLVVYTLENYWVNLKTKHIFGILGPLGVISAGWQHNIPTGSANEASKCLTLHTPAEYI